MAYVIKIIRQRNTGRSDAAQSTQGSTLNEKLISGNSVKEKLESVQSSNLQESLAKVPSTREAIENYGANPAVRQSAPKGISPNVKVALSTVGAIALDSVRQIGGNMGSFTRNTAAGNRANNALSLVGGTIATGVGLAGAAKLGSAAALKLGAAGPVGAVAAVAVAVGAIALNLATSAYNLSLNIRERQTEASKSAERLGRRISQRGRD